MLLRGVSVCLYVTCAAGATHPPCIFAQNMAARPTRRPPGAASKVGRAHGTVHSTRATRAQTRARATRARAHATGPVRGRQGTRVGHRGQGKIKMSCVSKQKSTGPRGSGGQGTEVLGKKYYFRCKAFGINFFFKSHDERGHKQGRNTRGFVNCSGASTLGFVKKIISVGSVHGRLEYQGLVKPGRTDVVL